MSTCAGCAAVHDGHRDGDLPVNPFLALRARYGMLLGEDDFMTLIGHGRGKLMLHNAWLHGPGIVHGYHVTVTVDAEAHTLRVSAGLAVDGLGRELHLDGDWCGDLAALVRAFAGEGTVGGSGQERTVDAWLSARIDPYETAPVPALADPCDLSRQHTANSRVVERVRLTLRPGPCPAPPPAPYHRVRVLLGLDEAAPGDLAGHEAAEAAARVAELPEERRTAALLDAFHRLAAADAADLTPFTPDDGSPSLFPHDEPGAVPLAALRLRVHGYGKELRLLDHHIDLGGRPTLLPTATVADLVCGLAPALLAAHTAVDAGGPRVARTVEWPHPHVLRLRVTAPLLRGSLTGRPVTVTSLSAHGWVHEDIARIAYGPDELTLSVFLHDPPVYDLVRVTVRGTGPTPVFGARPRVPLAGLVGGPPGSEHDGHDAVLTLRSGSAATDTGDEGDEGDAP
ncbi:hypothetical protein [Streptomyces kanamyceticus]|uniref:Uncharacterized protein n=1 Tax=Streptomyces kanamyceticus TaxID=1967 RepID=A0A5J6GMZ7_STRKN|nr:hypothetical protein [Streptomyces kanamyceticus]QEU96627.1 hypothetical protein CP970_41865 [Streptomyces kanamyceticus]